MMSSTANAKPEPAARFVPLLGALWADAGPRVDASLAVKDAATGRYVWADQALTDALCPGVGLAGRSDAECFDGPTTAALRAADQTAGAHPGVLASEHRFEAAGTRHDYTVLRQCVALDGTQWLASLWIDRSAVRQRESQLRNALEQLETLQRAHEALHREFKDQGLRDSDSGLNTRAHFEDQLRREVDLSTREHREFALVFIELDPPGEKVTSLGAPAHSRVLETMGRLLRGNTRAMDASCRLDAQRFGVLLSGVGLATAHSRMEGLRRQCATQIVVHQLQELAFTVSVGVASFPHTAHSQDELLQACQSALAEARRRGGNQVTLASIRFEAG